MAKITCPHCGHGGNITTSSHGLTLRCPQCHSLFLMRFDAITESELRAKPPPQAPAATASSTVRTGSVWTRGRTANKLTRPALLVVADDEIIREGLAMVLQAASYDVATVANGREALDHLQGNPATGLILLNMVTPEHEGDDFLRRRAQDEGLSAIPVLVITAPGAGTAPPAGPGIYRFLSKPVAVAALLEHVQRCLEAANG